jgi:ATP-dependent Clp protease ATP-binding subunit ClpC
MWQRFSKQARSAVMGAEKEMQALGTTIFSADVLFLAIITDRTSSASQILTHLGVDLDQVDKALREAITATPQPSRGRSQMSRGSKRAIDLAYDEARGMKDRIIGTEHVLLGVLQCNEGIAKTVVGENVTASAVRLVISQMVFSQG